MGTENTRRRERQSDRAAMHVHATIVAIASLSLSLTLSSPEAGSTAEHIAVGDSAPPRITIESASPEWTRRVEWGLDRFRDAGLALPPIAISVHDGRAECNGEDGLYRPGNPVRIHLCTPAPSESRAGRLITLHELAHAWAETQMTEEERAALLRLRGLDAWTDSTIPRHEWGAEHAAEVVSWGLMDEMIGIVRIHDASPDELAVAFDLLVRESPLWTGRASISEVVRRPAGW